jgi:hypothetical protein
MGRGRKSRNQEREKNVISPGSWGFREMLLRGLEKASWAMGLEEGVLAAVCAWILDHEESTCSSKEDVPPKSSISLWSTWTLSSHRLFRHLYIHGFRIRGKDACPLVWTQCTSKSCSRPRAKIFQNS